MHTPQEILMALSSSIEHWTDNLTGEKPSIAAADCALCDMFCDSCTGCPLRGYDPEGYGDCYGTPYYAARASLQKNKLANFHTHCRDMIVILEIERDKLLVAMNSTSAQPEKEF
jgi:hypothetical protein